MVDVIIFGASPGELGEAEQKEEAMAGGGEGWHSRLGE